MANIAPVFRFLQKGVTEVTWTLAANDVGNAVNLAEYPNKTLVVRGVFGGSLLVLQGNDSFDPALAANWINLGVHDSQGNEIRLTIQGVRRIDDSPSRISPFNAGGDVSTNLIVTICCS